MKTFLLLAISASAQGFQGFNSNHQLFEQWKIEHGKSYATVEEHGKRFGTWQKWLDIVEKHNADERNTWTMAMNEHADLTQEEFNQRNTLRHRSTKGTLHVPSNNTAPASVDWRTKNLVNAVKNQGQCGSCWAFSTVVSLEGQIAKSSGDLPSLSEQDLVDCVKDVVLPGDSQKCCDGCQGGLMDYAFDYIIKSQSGKDATEASYQYTGSDGTCKFSSSSKVGTITGYKDIPAADESALKDAVATVGPISIGVDASMGWQLYSGGIYKPAAWNPFKCSSAANKMDHGVAVVGYGSDSGEDYWIVRNSWGASWGEQGYMRLVMGQNACGVANAAVYPTM